MVLNINNEELIKKKIADKDTAKLKYKQKLNSIKQNKIEKLLSERITNLTPEEILYLSIHLNSALKE